MTDTTTPAEAQPLETKVMQQVWIDCSAFPVTSDNYANRYCEQGMSLRDYFAAKALTGVLYMVAHGAHDKASSATGCAAEAYALADAMMSARAVQRT